MVLVSIFGDFHSSLVPILYFYKKEITAHIIIYDNNPYTKNRLARFVEGQHRFLRHYRNNGIDEIDFTIETVAVDETSYKDIVASFRHIQKCTAPENLFLNATDGNNILSIILSSLVLQNGSRVIVYDRYANRLELLTSGGMQKQHLNDNLDIHSHLLLKGYEILNRTPHEAIQTRAETILTLMQEPQLFKRYIDGTLGETRLCKTFDTLLERIGKRDDINYIRGTLFEEYIYLLLCTHFDFDDVWTSVEIAVDTDIKNEFDILMIKENHLHMIECKFVNFLNGEHYVYKSGTVIDYLDDDGKAMILSIGGANERFTKSGKKRVQFTRADRKRAQYQQIYVYQSPVFNQEDFLNTVEKWFEVKRVR